MKEPLRQLARLGPDPKPSPGLGSTDSRPNFYPWHDVGARLQTAPTLRILTTNPSANDMPFGLSPAREQERGPVIGAILLEHDL